MADIKYEIKEEIAVLSENSRGWRKELNLVSWNDGAPKYDIREWAPDHERMGKGVTLTPEEFEVLTGGSMGSALGEETEPDFMAPIIFNKYLPLIYTVDELWDEFQTYCRQFFGDRGKDYFVFKRDPKSMNTWASLISNMGGGVPLMVFASGAFLLLAYEKSGHDLDDEVEALPEKWQVEEFD